MPHGQRKPQHDFSAQRTPRGGLQAAEYEDRKLGRLHVAGSRVIYKDAETGEILMDRQFANDREAGLQLSFYRATYDDVKTRRSSFRIVEA